VRVVLVAVAVFLTPAVVLGLSCDTWFPEAEGTLPALMFPTGAPDDPGELVVQDGVLYHTEPGSAHLVWLCDSWFPPGGMGFEVLGAEWEAAWRITGESSSSGECLLLSHDDLHGDWSYSLSKMSWEGPDPSVCPDCQYMWHNGTAEWTLTYPTDGPVEGWQVVWIVEPEPPSHIVSVTIDQVSIFEVSCEAAPEGCLTGLGCSGGEVGAPSFDNLTVWWPDPVEEETWGRVKALYRQELVN